MLALSCFLLSEASELALVKKSFTSLFALDAKVAFESLFQQVREGEDNLRANCLTFLKEQIGLQKAAIAADEALQKSIADGVKSVLGAENGVSPDELKNFIDVLRGLKIYSTDKELPATVSAIIASQAGLQKPFEPTNDAAIQNLVSCVQMAARLNPPRARRPKSAAESKEEVKEEAKTVDNSAFLLFFKDKILPVFGQVSEANKLTLLKTFADSARNASADTAAALFPSIVELVKTFASGEVVAAPAAAASAAAEPAKPTPISTAPAGPKINYSLVEALLVFFHRLGSKNHHVVKEVAGLFTPTGQPSDFRPALRDKRDALVAKLKITVDSVGPYLAQLKAVSLKLKEKRQATKEDAEKKSLTEKLSSLNLANRTAENVNRLASALLKPSPEILNLVPSSWGLRAPKKKGPAGSVAGKKRTNSAGPAAGGQKRTKGDMSGNNAGAKRSNSQTRGGGSAGRGRRGGGGGGNKRVNTGGNNNSGGQGAGSRSNSRGAGPRGRGRGRGRRGQ